MLSSAATRCSAIMVLLSYGTEQVVVQVILDLGVMERISPPTDVSATWPAATTAGKTCFQSGMRTPTVNPGLIARIHP